MSTATRSLCVTCDAEPDKCTHEGLRYLEPLLFDRTDQGGFQVPPHELERWRRGPTLKPAKSEDARELPALLQELEPWLTLDAVLQHELTAAYERNPGRVTRIVATVRYGCQERRFTNPGGLLWKKLREVP